MQAIIRVALKKTVLDVQGRAITKALQGHGHEEVLGVRQGKFFEIELADGMRPETARASLERLAADVLSNPVIEDYEVALLDVAEGKGREQWRESWDTSEPGKRTRSS